MGKPLRLLLVEDSREDEILIVEELRFAGFDVDWRRVYSRQGLREALREGEWDIVVSDHNMPGFSSVEALRLLLESGREIPFIIVSGIIAEEIAVEAMKAGAHDFIMKGSLAKLPPAVDNAVHAAQTRRRHREAQREIQESREQLRRLAAHLETVREEERARLAREIHDELGGILTAVKMDISWLKRRCEGEEKLCEKLDSMTFLTDNAIKTMRRIITDLRPSILDDLGLLAAIEWQLNDFGKRSGLETLFEMGVEPDVAETPFTNAQSIAIFRILQEALTNVARHAMASRVEVKAWRAGAAFVLEVSDNGRGIAVDETKKRGSYGLLGMRERAHAIGGVVEVMGAKGYGSCVKLVLPLLDEAPAGPLP